MPSSFPFNLVLCSFIIPDSWGFVDCTYSITLQTFEQDNSEKFSDILKTTLALARVVEKYHNNGYLHLDIKPSNFLVIPETRELVILFDVDSVTSMDDIASGKVKCVSYSKGWAAPEQMQGKIDKLCPATDIYSIGAILFQKIMGRAVDNEDIGIFADWNFDGKMFEKVNPKIKRLLRAIFRKTLAANIKKRYQSVDALIEALEASVECVRDGTPYLISDCPNPNKNFLGREKELVDIATAFNSGKKSVFLHGLGGIGKSELAKKYAELHEKEYDAILFLSYEDSLEDLLDDIQIQNCDAETKNDNVKFLKKIFVDQRVLLIVDNFDVEIDSDDYLDAFLRLKVDKIFTTRTDFADMADDRTQQISIENLNSKELVSLFEKESMLSFSDEDRVVIDEILKTFNYYTLIVPILAKQLVSSGWSLETLREKAKQGLRAFEDTEKVAVAKDGRIYRKTGLDMIRSTFRMAGLTDIQRRVLTNLYFLRFVKINKEEYRKYLWKENEKRAGHIDAINDLLYLGWIKKKNTWQNTADAELDIHPIIVEMIEIELEPDITTSDIVAYVQSYMPWSDLKDHLLEGVDDWGPLYQDTIAHKLNWFCLFGSSLDLTNRINLTYVVDTFSKLINGNIFIIQLIDRWILNKLLNHIAPFMLKEDTSYDVQFKIANLLEVKWLEESIPRIGLKDDEEKEIEKNVRIYFFKTRDLLDKLSTEAKTDAIVLLCKPAVQLLSQYDIYHTIPKDIYDVICSFEETWESILEDALYTSWETDYESNSDENKDESSSAPVSNEETNSSIEKEDNREYYYFKKFRSDYPVENVITELLQDNELSLQEKSNVFDDILSELIFRRIEFFRLYGDSDASYEHYQILKKTVWPQIEILSSKYLDLCCEIPDNDFSIAEAELYISIAKAMQGDFDNLINRFNDVTDNTIELINDLDVCDANAWKSFTQFWDISDIFKRGGFSYFHLHGIGYYANIFRNLMLSHLAIPFLIKCVSSLEEKIERNNKEIVRLISSIWSSNPTVGDGILKYDVGESEDPKGLLYNWYRSISEFALNSAIEKGINTREGMRYFDTYTEYLEKAMAFVGTENGVNTEDIPFFHCYCQYETISDLCVEYYVQCYFDGMDVQALNEKIHQDKRLTESGIMSIYEKTAHEVFFEVERCWTVKGGYPAVMEYLKTFDWSRLETFLDFQEEYYLEKDDFSDDDIYGLNSRCDMYRAMIYAIKEDQKSFDEFMGYLWEDFESDFKKTKEYLHWSYFTNFEDIGKLLHGWNITYAFAGLRDIEKHQFALPYLIKCAEHIHDWFKTLPNYSEVMMYSWYKAIAEFALETEDDGGAYVKYQDKVDKMAEKHYEINFDKLDYMGGCQ